MKKILLIEDEPNIRKMVRKMLRREKFELAEAENGKQGLQLAQMYPPDLILCDITMPEIDGYEVLKLLRSNPETETIPFIFLSGRSDKIDWRQGMNLGADDYLTKPFTKEELTEAISCRIAKQVALNRQSQKQLDELRDRITHCLPHELRTPLNAILGFSRMMIDEYDDIGREEALKALEAIHSSGENLYRLIQNFLLYADLALLAKDPDRLERLRSSYETTSVKTNLTSLAFHKAQKLGRDEDLSLKIQEATVQISEENFNKIFEEVIDNAFKFSAIGSPVCIGSQIDQENLKIFIADCGRGMTQDQIRNLGAYMQFDRKLYEQQGSGLGLIIAKRLAEMHRGELSITSIPQQQTIIKITLPLAKESV